MEAFMAWSGVWGGLCVAGALIALVIGAAIESPPPFIATVALAALAVIFINDWSDREERRFVNACVAETVLNQTECSALRGANKAVLAIVSNRLARE